MRNFLEIKGRKVLVTGASGFIGSHLCNRFLEQGAEIYGVSRKIPQGNDRSVNWLQGDLTNIEFVKNIFIRIKPDFIFHLASYVSGSRDVNMVIPTFQCNLITTVNLLTAATEYDCQRIIIAGSMEEPNSSDEAIPCSPYAAAKWAGSGYARMFHSLYRTPVVIARIFMVYGPGQQDLKKLIPYVALSFLSNEVPHLSNGTRQVDWIYVEDVVNGLLTLAGSTGIEGQTIDLGSGILTSIRTVVEHLKNIINPSIDPLFSSLYDRPMERVRVARISETFDRIGWKPAIPLEKGLALTVDWYRNHYMTSETKGSEK